MMTMPGVGTFVALTMRMAVDNLERFDSSKDIGPWAGLTPRRTQSGERDVIGRITRAGDAALRTALYQAANAVMCRIAPSWLKAWALTVAARRGKRRATVALARRIGVALHRMWRDGTEFRFTRDDATHLLKAVRQETQNRSNRPGMDAMACRGSDRDAVPDDAAWRLASGPFPRAQFRLARGNRT